MTSVAAGEPVMGAAAARAAGATARQRVAAGLLAAAIFSLFVLAGTLPASSRGYGTHLQMGLPPCGFLTATGIPCATCGMTTAFAHAARGRLLTAMVVQPAGGLLSLAAAAVSLGALYMAATGRNMAPLLARIWTARTVVLFGVVVLLSWAYKLLAIAAA